MGQYRGTTLQKELPGLTRDYPPAHALALTVLRSWRAQMAQIGVFFTGGGLFATGIGLCIGGSHDCPVAATAPLVVSGIAILVASTVLPSILGSLSDSSFHRSIKAYNTHARDAGCPDPPAGGASGRR